MGYLGLKEVAKDEAKQLVDAGKTEICDLIDGWNSSAKFRDKVCQTEQDKSSAKDFGTELGNKRKEVDDNG